MEKLRSVAAGKPPLRLRNLHFVTGMELLSLFFHGVLRVFLVILEPASLKQLQSDSDTVSGKSQSSIGENGREEELRGDRMEARVSSSAHERYMKH